MRNDAVFLDFDNTVTIGDVLDTVIERFSVTDQWREWESAWQRGELTTSECLSRQIANLRVGPDELAAFVQHASIDVSFPRIVEWCARQDIPLRIVSDNFGLIVRAILHRHSLGGVTVLANELRFEGNVPTALFPHTSSRCGRCAHCKAKHFAAYAAHRTIFVGDGLSDICPAEAADVVFAKDALARHLSRAAIPFIPFSDLAAVHHALQSSLAVA